MKLKLNADRQLFPNFVDKRFTDDEWKDGEEREVDDDKGAQMLSLWPKYFECVAKAETVPENKAEMPAENKGERPTIEPDVVDEGRSPKRKRRGGWGKK